MVSAIKRGHKPVGSHFYRVRFSPSRCSAWVRTLSGRFALRGSGPCPDALLCVGPVLVRTLCSAWVWTLSGRFYGQKRSNPAKTFGQGPNPHQRKVLRVPAGAAPMAAAIDLKNACVRAAREVIAERGIEALSLRDVARKLGVSHQAPYKHYPSRDHLLAEVMGRCFAEFARALDGREESDQPAQDLGALGRSYLRYAAEHPLEYRLMFGTPWPHAGRTPGAGAQRRARLRRPARRPRSRLWRSGTREQDRRRCVVHLVVHAWSRQHHAGQRHAAAATRSRRFRAFSRPCAWHDFEGYQRR